MVIDAKETVVNALIIKHVLHAKKRFITSSLVVMKLTLNVILLLLARQSVVRNVANPSRDVDIHASFNADIKAIVTAKFNLIKNVRIVEEHSNTSVAKIIQNA